MYTIKRIKVFMHAIIVYLPAAVPEERRPDTTERLKSRLVCIVTINVFVGKLTKKMRNNNEN